MKRQSGHAAEGDREPSASSLYSPQPLERQKTPRALQNVFHTDGDYWTIVFDRQPVRLRNVKGLQYLAHLLRYPGEQVQVAELISSAPEQKKTHASSTGNDGISGERIRKAVTNRIRDAIARIDKTNPSLGMHLAKAIRTGSACSSLPGGP
jgi:hypothetical protein